MSKVKDKDKYKAKANGVAGKKRARNGAVKENGSGKHDGLLDDIIALGGTREDLELVQDVDSNGEEQETATSSTKKNGKVRGDSSPELFNVQASEKELSKELKNFMSGLGLKPELRPIDASESEDEEDEEDESQEETNNIDESESEESEESDDAEGDDQAGESEESEESESSTEDSEQEATPIGSESKTTTPTPSSTESLPKIPKRKSPCSLEPQPQWYAASLPTLEITSTPSASFTKTKLEEASRLLDEENERFEKDSSRMSASDKSFLSTVLQSGTLNDKVSALTLVVQESPLHSIKTMKQLLGMAQKKGRNEAVQTVAALKDLMVGSVLPDRKLKYFHDQPITNLQATKEHLIIWAFEDYLKKYYFNLLQIMETLSHDTLQFVRVHMVVYFFDLLKDKPEQEQNVLRLLVNKLGDNDKKVSSKTSYQLQQLFLAHPNMKAIVIGEVEQLIMRPNVSERAQYYGILTLNQTVLTRNDIDVANKLIEIYFTFFHKTLAKKDHLEAAAKLDAKVTAKAKEKSKKDKKKNLVEESEAYVEEQDARMVAAVLTGVNRAFPFSDLSSADLEKHVDTLFKITHSGTFNTSIQALMLIFQVSASKQTVSDRFYRTLYESLIDRRVITSSKQSMYLNLLFRAIKADNDTLRVKAFVKRIIQVCSMYQPPMICGAVYMISQLTETHPSIVSLLDQPEDTDDAEAYHDAADSDEEADDNASEKKEGKSETVTTKHYDGRKRDPQFSNADQTYLWELVPFLNHFHPSVSLYSSKLVENEAITEKPDLGLHTLSHFLDRFVYRNPKKNPTKGGSIMQPSAATGVAVVSSRKTTREAAVNSDQFWRQKVEDVPVDQIFFHQYFAKKKNQENLRKQKVEKRKSRDGSDDEDGMPSDDVGSEQDEDEIWKAMVDSMPGGAEMDEGDEDDDELEGLEFSDDEDLDLDADDAEAVDDDDDDDVGNLDAMMMDEDDQDEVDTEDLPITGAAGSDDDMPNFLEDVEDLIPSDDDDEEDRRRKKNKKRKKEKLPLFASVDDYAHMLE